MNRRPKWIVSETDTKNWNVHNYPRVDPVPHNHRSMIYVDEDIVDHNLGIRSDARPEDYMDLVRETSQLLSRLPTHLASDLFASATRVKLAANQVLFLADDPGDSCYRVEDGLLKVTMVSRSGIERILSFIGRGGIVGELAILDGLPRSASVVAVRDTVLSRLSRAAFDAFAEEHPELYKSLITLLTQRLRETNVAVAAGSFLSLQGRVALTLLELADHFGRKVGSDRIIVEHKIGQGDLAAMAGIARENVNRVLKDWERRQIVSCRSGYYCLEDKSKLEREVQQF